MPAAIIGAVVVAGSTAYNAYNASQSKPGAGTAPVVQETPEERQFYEMQTLQAENAATQEEAALQNESNSAQLAATWVKYVAWALGGYLMWKILTKRL